MLDRRNLTLAGVAGALAAGFAALTRSGSRSVEAASGAFEVSKSDEDWRQQLTSAQYRVLRQHGTERAGSSALDKQYAAGTYVCAGCDLPLFSSKTKFNSHTGWPSFYAPLENAIGTSVDSAWGMTRTEVRCHRCHVFDDGPKPTGLRYCMNGVALKFLPESKAS
jgi:peptide-methionine (R)-S-oxide reductase